MRVLLAALVLAFGADSLWLGLRGLQGKEITLANRAGPLKRIAGAEARFWGWFYLVLGLSMTGIGVVLLSALLTKTVARSR